MKTLTGLPRLYAEPFPLVRRNGEPERDTLPSPPPPPSSELPRACNLEVTARVARPRLRRTHLVRAAVLALYALTLGVWATLLWGWQ